MFQFGIGGMFGVPVAGNQSTPSGPVQFGVIQDVSVDISGKNVPLRGQKKFPEDVATSDIEIKGKAAFGKIEVEVYNNLFFGETVASGIREVVDREAGTIPGTPYQITVAGSATYYKDLGVLNALTGAPYVKVASSPATGQYSVNETTGVYTFAAADTTLTVKISYVKTTSASGRTLTATNRIQGYGPIFELWLTMPYQGNNGLRLYRCRASKMDFPMKRADYTIPNFEFEAYADASDNVFDFFQISA